MRNVQNHKRKENDFKLSLYNSQTKNMQKVLRKYTAHK